MKRTVHLIYYTFIALMLAATVSCSSQPANETNVTQKIPPSTPKQKRPRINLILVEKLIHDRINAERLKHGLPTMRLDDALTRIARKHSQDMASRNYFGHASPEGYDYAYRYQKAGYACGITVDGVTRTGEENIFQIRLNALTALIAEEAHQERLVRGNIAATAVQGWMGSPTDRKNILSPIWQREGIGVSVGLDDMIFITLNFC